jgi:flagellar FliL protein
MSGKKLTASKEDKGPGYIADQPALEGEGGAPGKKSRRGLMLLLFPALFLLIAGAGGFLVFSGIVKLPFLTHAKARQAAAPQMQFIKMPELVANLDAGADADSYAKMQAELEVTDAVSAAAVTTPMPAIIDLFQSYLRTMQPGDLQGAEGLYRLREALLARANVIVAPASVQDVLFIELIVQ